MIDLAREIKVEAPASLVDQPKYHMLARVAAAIAISVRKADDALTISGKLDLHAVRSGEHAVGGHHWARNRGVEFEDGGLVSAGIHQVLQLGPCEARIVEVAKAKMKPAMVEILVDPDGYRCAFHCNRLVVLDGAHEVFSLQSLCHVAIILIID